MREHAPRILLAGGGSGGSATPVLAVAERIQERAPAAQLVLVGTADGPEARLAADAGLRFVAVPSGKLRRYWSWQNFVDPLRVAAGLVASADLVRRLRPDAAFAGGGFAAVPPLTAAALLGCPVHIHQQDAQPGLANRLLMPLAKSCSVSLESSLAHFPGGKTTLTGNPVRPSVLLGEPGRAVERFNLESDVPLVLVTGGGTGALGLNRLVAKAAPLLVKECQVVHLTGRGRGVPPEQPLDRYQQIEFVTAEMADLLAAATVVVTRAGMGTLSELSALGKASIVVPMPGSHQGANARAFAAKGGVVACGEADLTPERLAEVVLGLVRSDERRSELERNIRACMPRDAADRLADIVLTLAGC